MPHKGQFKEFCINGHPRTPENVEPVGRSCRVCTRASAKLKRQKQTPEDKRKRCKAQQNFARTNPESILATKLKGLYGLTLDAYKNALLAQENRCAICTREFTESSKPVVDHCHRDGGKFRALLCKTCNSGLGMLQDSTVVLKSAVAYLEKHNSLGGERNMPRYLVEFFGEVEIEAENEILAEVDAINTHADAHVRALELTEEEHDILS